MASSPEHYLARQLGLRLPLLQAPMAGVSTAALAGAVSSAGGLGSIAVGAMSAAAAGTAIREAMSACAGRLNVNVFTHARPRRDPAREAAWLHELEPRFREFGVAPPDALDEIYRTFDDDPDMLDVLLSLGPPAVSFHFGLPRPASLRALKQRGTCLIATATSVDEARRAEAAGIDVIVAQGYEAGGHRGVFSGQRDECLPTFSLLPRIVSAVGVPVLAAGGIMTGAGIVAALTLGASGVQMGTAFVDCPESSASDAHRRALRDEARNTAMTSVFSGRPARGIVNRFVREMAERARAAPDYPVAYDAGKRLAAAAQAGGCTEFTAMWAGQGPARAQVLAASDLVVTLAEEMDRARNSVAAGAPTP